jgi:hypothetical protein
MSIAYPDLIVYAPDLEAEFDYMIHTIWLWERLIHCISSWHIWLHEVYPHVELFVLHFTLCFVKAFRWWGVTRFAQPMYICTCSVLMSSLPFTNYLKNYKW